MQGIFGQKSGRGWKRLTYATVSAIAAVGLALVTVTPASAAQPLGPGNEGMNGPRPTTKSVQPMIVPAGIPGIDVSHYQGSINWTSVRNAGIQFAYIKATESTNYKDPTFNANYVNAYNAGVIRGAYHFGRPAASSGAAQANYLASNGGAWSADGRTLPAALDLEAGCAGLSQGAMVNWIRDFYNTYKARTGRDVVIYTAAGWWSSCTGNSSAFRPLTPLWVASWTSASSPTIPGGFGAYTFWQYTSTGSVPGISGNVDRDVFNGSRDRLIALANNTP
jgi:GH25 family lysozyme M1 (1,4-beta-N-acetylmuramidase)